MPEQPERPDFEQLAIDLAAVVGTLSRRLRTTSADSRLSPTQRLVLSRLGNEGPATTAALARAEFVRPQSMRLTLAALEEQGLVERAPDPQDGRQAVMSITDRGSNTLAVVRAAKRDWLTQALTGEMNAAELRTLTEAVSLLQRLIEK